MRPAAESIRIVTLAAVDVGDQAGRNSIDCPLLSTVAGGFNLSKDLRGDGRRSDGLRLTTRYPVHVAVFVLRNEITRQTFAEAIEPVQLISRLGTALVWLTLGLRRRLSTPNKTVA